MSTTRVAAPQKVSATVTADTALTAGRHTPVDASAAPRTMTLPTGQGEGVVITVEKVDSSANPVTVSGSIRGAAGTITLTTQFEARTFLADAAGSWRPVSDHRTQASLNATFTAATRPTLVGDGATNDTPAINTALATAAAAGHRTVIIEPNTNGYAIKRQTPASQKGGGINMVSGSRLVGKATRLTVKDNCSAINVRGKGPNPFDAVNSLDGTTAISVITADTAASDTNLSVVSSTGFVVGDEVIVRLGQAAYDTLEPDYWVFAKVAAIPDSTHVTIDRPVDYAMTVASTPNQWNRVIGVVRFVENVTIDGFFIENTMTGGGNEETGIDLLYARNVTINRISGTNPGAGLVVGQFCEDVSGDVIDVIESAQQGGQASKGRGIGFAESRNIHFGVVRVAKFAGTAVVSEGRTENFTIDSLMLDDTAVGRDGTVSMVSCLGNAHINLPEVWIGGNGGTITNAISDPSFYNIGHLTLHTKTQSTLADLSTVQQLTIDSRRYRRIRRVSRTFQLVNNGNAIAKIPDGLVRTARVYVSTKTGVGYSYLMGASGTAGNFASLLAAGESRSIAPLPSSATGIGPAYLVNASETGKQFVISADATLPAGAWARVEVEMFVPAVAADADDHSFSAIDAGDLLVLRSQDNNTSVIRRDPANGDLVTPSKTRVGSLGVGNAAAATTPGSVVKKIEVFDAAGASLGFVPVYSTIT